MNALIRAEFRKLVTTRLWWLLLIVAGVLTAVATSAAIGFAEPGPLGLDTAGGQRIVLAQGSAASPIVAILGIIAVTGEFGHQTATPTFLATPRRGRVVLAKLITYAVVGIAYGAACTGLVLAIALPWLSAKGVDYTLSAGETARSLVGVGAALALYAVVGVGVGALVRNQIAAVVGLVVYLFIVGPILSGVQATSGVAKFQPWQASNSLTRLQPSENAVMLTQLQGGLTLVAWAILLAWLGTRLTIRRDIT